MPKEKMGRPPKDRLPDHVRADVVSLIRKGVDELRRRDTDNTGYSTSQIVAHVHAKAVQILRDYAALVTDSLVARLVPTILGDESEVELLVDYQPLLENLELPLYFSVPETSGTPVWKRDEDVTPTDLDLIIEHRRFDIVGRQVTLQKYVALREAAVKRGCDMHEPVRTVLRDSRRDDGIDGVDRPTP